MTGSLTEKALPKGRQSPDGVRDSGGSGHDPQLPLGDVLRLAAAYVAAHDLARFLSDRHPPLPEFVEALAVGTMIGPVSF